MTIAVDWGRKANITKEQKKTGYVHKGASLATSRAKKLKVSPISFLISLLEI